MERFCYGFCVFCPPHSVIRAAVFVEMGKENMLIGDACIPVGDVAMGGLSTATNCFILNTCLIEGAKLALAQGVKPPVYISGNVEGGRDHNIVLEDMYLGRVKHL